MLNVRAEFELEQNFVQEGKKDSISIQLGWVHCSYASATC